MSLATKCPVIEVHSQNVSALWPIIVSDMRNCTFIALDAEMSGLGRKNALFQRNAEDRYKAIRGAAQTRSLISIGISCFRLRGKSGLIAERKNPDAESGMYFESEDNFISYHVKTYNVLLLCNDSFTIDSDAVAFLVGHGFDFNRQFSVGVRYSKGNDKTLKSGETSSHARRIFGEIVRIRKPVIVHNGLADLVYLYECLYATLPEKLPVFLADLSEMFPSGVYDTKLMVQTRDQMISSYLAYVFRKYEILNTKLLECGKLSLKVFFGDLENNEIHAVSEDCKISTKTKKELNVCVNFSKYGWCSLGYSCPRSHHVDDILAFHGIKEQPKKRKRKRRKISMEGVEVHKDHVEDDQEVMDVQHEDITGEDAVGDNNSKMDDMKQDAGEVEKKSDELTNDQETSKMPRDKDGGSGDSLRLKSSNSHRAGTDSFMTGYSFAMFTVNKYEGQGIKCEKQSPGGSFSSAVPLLSEEEKKCLVNRLYFKGNNIPIRIYKSEFAKTSQNHNDKYVNLFLE